MLRRLMASLAVVSLLGSGTTVAQSPSPDPTSTPAPTAIPVAGGQRAEVPGIAVTFPADWQVRIRMASGQVPEELAGPDAEALVVLTADAPDGATRCGVIVLAMSGLTPAGFAERDRLWLSDAPRWSGTVESVPVKLPAGEAVRIDVRDDPATMSEDGNVYVGGAAFATDYVLGHGDAIIVLGCRTDDRVVDDWPDIADTWRSIAESIESSPVEA